VKLVQIPLIYAVFNDILKSNEEKEILK